MALGYYNQSAPISASASGDNTVVAAVPNSRIVVLLYALVNNVGTAQAVTWKSGASTSLSGAMALTPSAGGGLTISTGDNKTVLFATNPGEALVLNLSAATATAGHVSYRVVPA